MKKVIFYCDICREEINKNDDCFSYTDKQLKISYTDKQLKKGLHEIAFSHICLPCIIEIQEILTKNKRIKK